MVDSAFACDGRGQGPLAAANVRFPTQKLAVMVAEKLLRRRFNTGNL
jgi:hypothetical protein